MAEEIQTWTNYVTSEFQTAFNLDLWKKFPSTQITELEKEVVDRDSFISRLVSLSAFFDSVNKKGFDEATGQKTIGSRLAVVAYLKFELQNYHSQIDMLFDTLNMINLLRAHYVHVGNSNYKEALKYFSITEPLMDYRIAWAAIRLKFEVFLADFSKLIQYKNVVPIKQTQLVNDTVQTLFLNVLQGQAWYFKNQPLAKMMLREIAVKGQMIDTELAAAVGQPIGKVRSILLPLTDSFLRISFDSNQSTMITIRKHRTELQNIDYWLNYKNEG
jgi:hypothetical protein